MSWTISRPYAGGVTRKDQYRVWHLQPRPGAMARSHETAIRIKLIRARGDRMTARQKLELRQSEIRSRLADLGAGELADEGKGEIDTLSVEYSANESRIRAFMVSEDAPVETTTTERRDSAELYARASVGDLVFNLVNGRSGVDGAMRELQQEHKMGDNEIHVRQLAPVDSYAVTPGASDVGQNQQEIIPYVFPDSVGAYLNIDMPTVGVGEAVFPVLSSELAVGTPAENAEQDETTGAFTADVLSPKRLQASFFYSREDRARFAGMDSALRENLSMGLSDGLDEQIIAGTTGLTTGTVLANHNVSAQTTYALYRSQFAYARVDGRYAVGTENLRVVMGATAYAHAASQYRGNNDNTDALMALKRETGGVRVSAHIPDAVSNKQNQIIRRGARRDMVAPIWENVALIPDEVTKAKAGQIVLTAVMLHAVKLLRSDGFYKQQVQTA